MKTFTKTTFKKCLFLAFILVALTIVFSLVVRYQVVGEDNLPYAISKILIVSKVSTSDNDQTANLWDINLEEDNDVYIYIDKSDEESTDTLQSVTLENFRVTKPATLGNAVIYRPTGDLENLYDYSEQNYLGDSITYTGAKIDTMKTLEIRNEGGTIGFRASLENLGNYVSNEEHETITYDGSLIKKAGIEQEEIEFQLAFDVLITLNSNVTFKGTITLDLPNDDILTNPESNIEITDFSDVVFKRI